jgi:hypothetical protein
LYFGIPLLNRSFNRIDKYLSTLSSYWLHNAFFLNDYSDLIENTHLIDLLKDIDDVKLKQYQQNPHLLFPLLKTVIPELLDVQDPLFDVPPLPQTLNMDMPFWLNKGVKGRKWIQIDLFSNHCHDNLPILEWCAGKGHLGRLIHYKTSAKISAVEWNSELCSQGKKIAKQQGIDQNFKVANVLKGEADVLLEKHQHVVALHACGDLHLHLLKQVEQSPSQRVTLSPCCYHLTTTDCYDAISSHAQQHSELLALNTLTKQHLKLAVAQQSTSGTRQMQLNDQEVWWRLSFDCLQQALLKTETYLNVPSFPKTLLSKSFREFAEWTKAYKQLDIELPADLSIYLEQGRKRFNCLRRVELITQFFRRPLELWLVLDRAISLQESGYQVQLSTFCEPHITPRNLLIQASLPS